MLVAADSDDQVGANIDYGTFKSPSARVRPRFRYWLPDAAVDKATVRDNIASAGSVGAGGVEFLPFYNYGGELGSTDPSWASTGFGTEAFKEMFLTALEAHKEFGLVMDFALGPNQGQGVPAETDDEGLQWDLAPFSLQVNGSFDGIIPGWGSGELVALVSAEVLSTQNIPMPDSSSPLPGGQKSYQQLILRNGTLMDHASQVSSSGHVTLHLPTTSSRSKYWLFAFYQYRTLHKNLQFNASSSKTIFDNGSYVVDHFSSRGARVTTRFWENHILTPRVEQLLREVGNYGWEDSVEIKSNISWSPSLPTLFKNHFGYSLTDILPLVMFGNNNQGLQSTAPGKVQCLLDTSDMGQGHVNDFREALGIGYRQYLQALTSWITSRLDLQMSSQVSYNLPGDMEAAVPFVNAPECESLGFKDSVDAYRQFSGPAVLTGKRVISNEMGAVMLEAYRYPLSRLLWSIHRAVAGGVNQMVLHGQAYTGNYSGTTWPGYTAFLYLFSEQYSHKQPAWDHGFSDALNYVSRLQYTQQIGKLHTDVAVYNKISATDIDYPDIYLDNDLVNDGYTYNYLSPDNFALPQAKVSRGVLAPEGPSYKALVIPHVSNVSREGIIRVQEFARQGLPIIISGGDPGHYASHTADDAISTKKALSDLKKMEHVHMVSAGGVADKLASLNILPDIKVKTNGTWYTTWREDKINHVSYCFVFNNANDLTVGTVDVASAGVPHVFDAWTGDHRPLLLYRNSNNRTTVPLRLAANQTAILAFRNKRPGNAAPRIHAIQAPSALIGYTSANSSNEVWVHIASGPWDSPLLLSNGRAYRSPPIKSPHPSFQLANWTLVLEHWDAPSNLSDAATIAVKHNTTHQLELLVSWTEIPAAVNVSGIGYYRSNFHWPPPASNGSADGAYIRLPKIQHAARVYINGQIIGPLDFAAPQGDISTYLRPGRENSVLVEVPSTMWNYLRSIIDKLMFFGQSASRTLGLLGELPEIVDNGLIGEVEIVPYVKFRLESRGK
ncbi:hypothetical protein P170DRAFT_346874 [Aspergillus steynii IBT 23096]|uniref:Secreted protein n=1 Tax=Aspergillus steynii IBT 23096 TaxID=1392250 RepID=A0A2I2GLD1_9EURO|nr:uncharacterized protein P170DRAFT_346874 [Aspergillus steynii IBT 23096]PLB53682.1 hypothetical protein P170DRAFT_346874 [Aspergillus steynii IBT 23096]